MSNNMNPNGWRNISGIGHGRDWGVPSGKSSKSGSSKSTMKQGSSNFNSAKSSNKDASSKGLNAKAKPFVPGGSSSKK